MLGNLKIDVYYEGSKLHIDFPTFDSINIDITRALNNEKLHMGLFDTFISGNLAYTIEVKNGAMTSDVKLACDSIDIKSDSVSVGRFAKQAGKTYDFVYKIDDLVWEFPTEVKSFLSLTGDTLALQVASFLTSLQTELRNQVENKVKIDFVGNSVSSVVNIADSIKNVVYGQGDAIISEYEGSFKANFSSPEAFVSVLNKNQVIALYFHPTKKHYARAIGKTDTQRSYANAGEWAYACALKNRGGNKTYYGDEKIN